VVSGYSHALYSALCGMGIVWLVGRPGGEPRRVGRGLLSVALAVVFHTCLDAFAVQGRVLLLPILALVCVVVIIGGERWAARQERVWMHDLMAPEVDRGTITADELAALAGSHRDRRRFVKAAGHGHRHHHQARHVLHAATDLAEDIARAGGDETPEVAFSRQEVFRLRGA